MAFACDIVHLGPGPARSFSAKYNHVDAGGHYFESCVPALPRNPQGVSYLKQGTQERICVPKGARNGFVYGVKVRFPHALVMSILFGRGE